MASNIDASIVNCRVLAATKHKPRTAESSVKARREREARRKEVGERYYAGVIYSSWMADPKLTIISSTASKRRNQLSL